MSLGPLHAHYRRQALSPRHTRTATEPARGAAWPPPQSKQSWGPSRGCPTAGGARHPPRVSQASKGEKEVFPGPAHRLPRVTCTP